MNRSSKSALPGFPRKGQFTTKDEIDQYFSDPDCIQCLLCGQIFTTLSRHLQLTHECSIEEYRGRYGLPWRKGLVSGKLSKRFSSNLTKRIKDGSFKPPADTTAAVDRIRAGGRRKDQPFFTAFKAERATKLNKKNIRYGRKGYEKVLAVMKKHKIPVQKACMDKNLYWPHLALHMVYHQSHQDQQYLDLDHGKNQHQHSHSSSSHHQVRDQRVYYIHYPKNYYRDLGHSAVHYQ